MVIIIMFAVHQLILMSQRHALKNGTEYLDNDTVFYHLILLWFLFITLRSNFSNRFKNI